MIVERVRRVRVRRAVLRSLREATLKGLLNRKLPTASFAFFFVGSYNKIYRCGTTTNNLNRMLFPIISHVWDDIFFFDFSQYFKKTISFFHSNPTILYNDKKKRTFRTN